MKRSDSLPSVWRLPDRWSIEEWCLSHWNDDDIFSQQPLTQDPLATPEERRPIDAAVVAPPTPANAPPPIQAQQGLVFISYSWANRESVDGLYQKLADSGIRCWRDNQQLRIADILIREIARAIRSCSVYLCCITVEFGRSRFCELEMNYAFKLGKKIAALRLDNIEMPEWTEMLTCSTLYYDVYQAVNGGRINWNSPALNKLFSDIRRLTIRIEDEPVNPANDVPGHTPAPGTTGDASQHAKRIQRMYKWLTLMLLAIPVADEMYQSEVLGENEAKKVKTRINRCEAVKQLLHFVLQRPYNKVMGFLDALTRTSQRHLYEGFEFLNDIHENFDFLLREMDSRNLAFLRHLVNKKVLTPLQKYKVERKNTSTKKNKKLLSQLIRKTPDDFNNFIEALRENNQRRIADRLMPTGRQE